MNKVCLHRIFVWICIVAIAGLLLPASVFAQTNTPTPTPRPRRLLRDVSRGLQLNAPLDNFADTCDRAPTTEGTIIASQNGIAGANGAMFSVAPGRTSIDAVRITDLMFPSVCNFQTGTWNASRVYAISPGGATVSPLIVASNNGNVDGIYLPIQAYLEPGTWTLGATAPEAFEITINLAPNKTFTIYDPYGGQTVIGAGNPGEQIVIINHNSEPNTDGSQIGFLQEETTFTLDSRGYGSANAILGRGMLWVGDRTIGFGYPGNIQMFLDGETFTLPRLVVFVRQTYWQGLEVAPGTISAPPVATSLVDRGLLPGIGVAEASITTYDGDLYRVTLATNEVVRYGVYNTEFAPEVQWRNAAGEDQGTFNAVDAPNIIEREFTAPTGGIYQLIVRSERGEVNNGEYSLYAQYTSPQPETFAPIVACGQSSRLRVGIQGRSAGGGVNFRQQPTLTGTILARIQPEETFTVLSGPVEDCAARLVWWEITFNGVNGYAAEFFNGEALLTSLDIAPVNSDGTTGGGTTVISTTSPLVPTAIPVLNPTATSFTPPVIDTPAPVRTLNFGLPANFGEIALTSGFSPDPYPIGITSGGSVNVSYLGGSCLGYATSAPDLQLTYISGGFALLRFYVTSSSDTTLVINSPNGGFFCSDDAYGLNPSIDFNSPSSGVYDIWVGSFVEGGGTSSTLYITELDSNHP